MKETTKNDNDSFEKNSVKLTYLHFCYVTFTNFCKVRDIPQFPPDCHPNNTFLLAITIINNRKKLLAITIINNFQKKKLLSIIIQ